jgi:hypothetical protein
MREMTEDRFARPPHVTFSDEKHCFYKKKSSRLSEELKDCQAKP